MTKITRLTEYMEVICNRPYMQDEESIRQIVLTRMPQRGEEASPNV